MKKWVLLTLLVGLVVVPLLPSAERYMKGAEIALYFLCVFVALGIAIWILWEAFNKTQ